MFIPMGQRKEKAREHWKRYRPKMYAQMVETGTLEKHLDNAVRAFTEAEDALMDKGMPIDEAGSLLLPDFLFLPAEEDMPSLGEMPGEDRERSPAETFA